MKSWQTISWFPCGSGKKHTVKGNVVDETGLPLPGVSVIIKGTTVGVATDADGNFQLEIAKLEGVILQFSMVGMKPQEVKIVPNRLSYNVVMQNQCTGAGRRGMYGLPDFKES